MVKQAFQNPCKIIPCNNFVSRNGYCVCATFQKALFQLDNAMAGVLSFYVFAC